MNKVKSQEVTILNLECQQDSRAELSHAGQVSLGDMVRQDTSAEHDQIMINRLKKRLP